MKTNLILLLQFFFTIFAVAVMAYYSMGTASESAKEIGVMILQLLIFTVKLFFLHFVFIWVRWTLPRFRYDQTQKLGWNILLPLSLANIFVTAIVVIIGVNYGS